VRRKLAGIEIEGGRLSFNASKWPVAVAGKTVGRVTSAIWSPRLAKNIGYAMVPVAQSALGTTITVDIPGAGQRKATVVAMPFIDPAKEIPKG
jgi:aminomethyltransferase